MQADDTGPLIAEGVDQEPVAANERRLHHWQYYLLFVLGVGYTLMHLISLNLYPLETWTFRLIHVAGVLVLGFLLYSARLQTWHRDRIARWEWGPLALAALCLGAVTVELALAWGLYAEDRPPQWVFWQFGPLLALGTLAALLGSWLGRGGRGCVSWADWLLALSALLVLGFILYSLQNLSLRLRAGTPFADANNAWAALVGVVLILEMTRRVAGMALVTIASLFVLYAFVGPWLPGFLEHSGYTWQRFFTYLYTDNGILGPTTAVSSTYIILFITFAAFLQASKVGDYFVNFAFAAAGRARGGPAKVAVFASGLMGMINGTSAGNVVATGSLTIPLMRKVGYAPRSSAAIEAAASTGGQIMPPIMGAGAFIMAEVTGIPYTELVIAALIPAILYFASIYFMVDLEATRLGMRGMRDDELPRFATLVKQVYLFLPILILLGALFSGYSVIRAGTLATISAMVISWLSPHRMGPKQVLIALELAARMSIQIIAVCACAGVIVGVIAMTGVGARFSSMLLGIANSGLFPTDISLLLALFFAMLIAIVLGMGMPTTAAYAVAAAVVAPGLSQILLPSFAEAADPQRTAALVAHFFVFYFAVISAITPPVALAAYAGAAIASSNPMSTSVTSFKMGLAAFIVPFIFCYSPAMLLEGDNIEIARVFVTSLIGVYLLASAVQGWFMGPLNALLRVLLLAAALGMISGGWITDVFGLGVTALLFSLRRAAPKMA